MPRKTGAGSAGQKRTRKAPVRKQSLVGRVARSISTRIKNLF